MRVFGVLVEALGSKRKHPAGRVFLSSLGDVFVCGDDGGMVSAAAVCELLSARSLLGWKQAFKHGFKARQPLVQHLRLNVGDPGGRALCSLFRRLLCSLGRRRLCRLLPGLLRWLLLRWLPLRARLGRRMPWLLGGRGRRLLPRGRLCRLS
jgi:hypothetical protein